MKYRQTLTHRLLSACLSVIFTISLTVPARAQSVLNLPQPGTMVPLSAPYSPAIVMGINVYVDNPLKFDFIIDKGNSNFEGDAFKKESTKLIKYFLASLTVQEEEMWVNLSPYEKNRIIPTTFGQTEMGRDLLAQDYMLKQLTSSLMYPESGLGKDFWDRVYSKAQEQFGTTEIPMNTFNKIWIVPETATLYEHTKGAFIVKSHLKVMLEEDYLALESNLGSTKHGLGKVTKDDIEIISGVSSEIVKEILIPEIEKEVNKGETFANLRQIYHSMLLATWYKNNLKESLLGQVYVDKGKTKGVDVKDERINQKIYNQYLEAFKKGVFNFIKEDYDPATQQVVPRKYFSGGVRLKGDQATMGDKGIKDQSGDMEELLGTVRSVKEGTAVTVELSKASPGDFDPTKKTTSGITVTNDPEAVAKLLREIEGKSLRTISARTDVSYGKIHGFTIEDPEMKERIQELIRAGGDLREYIDSLSGEDLKRTAYGILMTMAGEGSEAAFKLLKEVEWRSGEDETSFMISVIDLANRKNEDAIEILKDIVDEVRPVIVGDTKILAVNAITSIARDSESKELARWLLNGILSHRNYGGTVDSFTERDTYGDMLNAIIEEESLPDEVKIYAFGLLSGEGERQDMLEVSRNFLNANRTSQAVELVGQQGDAIWTNEIVKISFLAAWLNLYEGLKNSAIRPKEGMFEFEIDKLMNHTSLTEDYNGAHASYIVGRAAMSVGMAASLFGTLAHELGHRVENYYGSSIQAMSSEKWPIVSFKGREDLSGLLYDMTKGLTLSEESRTSIHLESRRISETTAFLATYYFFKLMGWEDEVLVERQDTQRRYGRFWRHERRSEFDEFSTVYVDVSENVENIFRHIEGLATQKANLTIAFSKLFLVAIGYQIEVLDSKFQFSVLSARLFEVADEAMVAAIGPDWKRGGIDFNPSILDMDVKSNGQNVKFQIPQQSIQNFDVDGFLPVIINITPISNLPLLLGLSQSGEQKISRLN